MSYHQWNGVSKRGHKPPTPETEQADVRKIVTQVTITQLEQSLDLSGQIFLSTPLLPTLLF